MRIDPKFSDAHDAFEMGTRAIRNLDDAVAEAMLARSQLLVAENSDDEDEAGHVWSMFLIGGFDDQ